MNQDSTRKARVNVRRAEVMEQVEKEIQQHYQSELISHIRSAGNVYNLGHTEFFLAREFGFCNGVRRAIDIAYAARRVFPDRRIFLIGDIIHNPEVNRQLEEMGIRKLPWKQLDSSYDRVAPDDVVIIPAFGVPTPFMDALEEKGVQIVDTTCGDVMKVWKRVKNYAAIGIPPLSTVRLPMRKPALRLPGLLGNGEGGNTWWFTIWRMPVSCATTSWAAETARHS